MRRARSARCIAMTFPLPPNATIGLVGGGQLGRMSALAAARLGYRCHILTRETDSPAGQVSAAATISDYQEPAALREFAAAVDVISFEFENVSAEGLELLASLKPVRPSPGDPAHQPGSRAGEELPEWRRRADRAVAVGQQPRRPARRRSTASACPRC